jgi:hypothetical protein
VKPDFSEFSYGYAVTEELVTEQKSMVLGAPTFPSLLEEGQAGGGYDVKIPLIGSPVFLQFKLSDRLERTNAKEHQNGLMKVPYYRMHLRPTKNSDQHNLLMSLEASGETVLYIAPEFHLPSELNSHYLDRTVVANSAAFSPLSIGTLPTDGPHYVVFAPGASSSYRCSSQPVEVPKVSLKDGLRSALAHRGVTPRQLGEAGLREISEHLLQALASREASVPAEALDFEGARRVVQQRQPSEAVAYMARTLFDAEVVVLIE